MKPKNEELLYFLLCTADMFMRPTWRNLHDSFETWAWRNGLGRRLAELERDKLIERLPQPELSRLVRLTDKGKQLALGGRDPAERWDRAWDGRWRFVLFDVPQTRHELRQQLLRVLRRCHFGCLQRSVWASPDPTAAVRAVLGETRVDAEAFLVVEGQPAAGESNEEIVQGAWNFERINHAYEQYLTAARLIPKEQNRVADWARRENAAWKAALKLDPLLPAALLPPNYRGREAFERRKAVLAQLATLT